MQRPSDWGMYLDPGYTEDVPDIALIGFQIGVDKFRQYFANFNRLFSCESFSFCHGIDDFELLKILIPSNGPTLPGHYRIGVNGNPMAVITILRWSAG
jgi:hypothetical protein